MFYKVWINIFSQAFCESVPIACIKLLCIMNLQKKITTLSGVLEFVGSKNLSSRYKKLFTCNLSAK